MNKSSKSGRPGDEHIQRMREPSESTGANPRSARLAALFNAATVFGAVVLAAMSGPTGPKLPKITGD